jgi:hypothetical protein
MNDAYRNDPVADVLGEPERDSAAIAMFGTATMVVKL